MNDINILFIDDEEFTLNALDRLLHREQYKRYYAKNGVSALKIMAETPIDIVVTDMKMPGMDGLTLLKKIKEIYPDTVRVALSAYTMTSQLLPCINSGEIYRFISKPIDVNELRQAISDAIDFFLIRKDRITLVKELKQKNKDLIDALEHQRHIEKQLKQLSITDELTGLFNRRYLTTSMEREFEQSKRYNSPLACLMMDLDHFKSINDTYGHIFGDFVLKEFSRRIKSAIRSADIGFRYGGEEFVVLLPQIDLEKAMILGERILQSCRSLPFQEKDLSTTVTVSIGAVCFKHHKPQSAKEMLKMADKMLYQAKEKGRNRICH